MYLREGLERTGYVFVSHGVYFVQVVGDQNGDKYRLPYPALVGEDKEPRLINHYLHLAK